MPWPIKRLGEVCEISAGGSAPQGEKFFRNGKYPFFRTADVGLIHLSDNLCNVKDYLNDQGIKKLKLFKKGAILFPKSGASTFLNHRVVMGCDGYVASHLATIFAGKNIYYKYLYYFLTQVDAKNIAPNSAYPSLRISDIKKIEIPLPPLSEQKRIVKRVEELFDKIDEAEKLREGSKKDSEALISATLHKIFVEGKKKGWEMKKIGDKEILTITSGGTPSRSNKLYYKGNIPWLKSGELGDNQNIIESMEHISKEAIKKSSAKLFPKDTILFAMYGATAGKLGVLGFPAATNQAVAGLICNSDVLYYRFLFFCLLHIRNEIILKAWGGAQPNLSQTIIKNFEIPLPPLSEQKKIVSELDVLSEKVQKIEELQKQTAQDFKALRQSILHQAFEGKL